ncbi:MAG: hypothetical protein LBC84_06690 [Prevotellaceae bacterium]|nr:hypothetical protein [Prevotellaceae bacterium]
MEIESNNDDNPATGTSGNGPFKIIATNVAYPDGGKGSIATVKAEIWDDDGDCHVLSFFYNFRCFVLAVSHSIFRVTAIII